MKNIRRVGSIQDSKADFLMNSEGCRRDLLWPMLMYRHDLGHDYKQGMDW
jgi:hypothetical protein